MVSVCVGLASGLEVMAPSLFSKHMSHVCRQLSMQMGNWNDIVKREDSREDSLARPAT